MAPPSDPAAGDVRRVSLPGDQVLSVRPVADTDARGLVALYDGLDEEDRYRRFFTAHAPPETFIEKMTKVAERGGYGLVAVIEGADGTSRIVGEASYEKIPDGNGELGITVAEHARGWLGPYLLDALLEAAAVRGVPNLEADVLLSNQRMLTMLRARGLAVMDRDEQPAIVRVVIGTTGRVPSWPPSHDRPRLLLEAPGGHWHHEDAARAAGFEVLACPGQLRGWAHCPALRGEPCPLVAGADVIVDAQPGERGHALLEAHRLLRPSVPICVEVPATADELGTDVSLIPKDASDTVVIGLLQRLAGPAPTGPGERPSDEPG